MGEQNKGDGDFVFLAGCYFNDDVLYLLFGYFVPFFLGLTAFSTCAHLPISCARPNVFFSVHVAIYLLDSYVDRKIYCALGHIGTSHLNK